MRLRHFWLMGGLAMLWAYLAVGAGAFASANPDPSPRELGQDIFQRLACHGCHSPSSPASHQGPDLGQVGQRLGPADLLTQLSTPRQRRADSRMPSFAFVRPHEIQALLEYVQSLP